MTWIHERSGRRHRRRRLHRRASRRRSPAPGLPAPPRRGHQAARRVVSAVRRRREPVARPEPLDACRARLRGSAARLQPRRRHGRHGVHRAEQGAVHALGADQHAPADGGPRRASSASSIPRRRASTRRKTDERRGDAAARGRTPTRRCRRTATAGRSCSASGCAGTSPRTSASRRGGALPQRLRAARDVRRRPREGAGGDLPQGDQAKLSGNHEIEIWGDGEQTRSFTYIDDCLYGTQA